MTIKIKVNKMEKIEEFELKFQGRWDRIKFYKELPTKYNPGMDKKYRFCEAISNSIITPFIVVPANLNCISAKYIFGWDNSLKKEIVNKVIEKNKISFEFMEDISSKTPKLNGEIKAIGLNTDDYPDVLICYAQPELVMNLLKSYQKNTGKILKVQLSNMFAICGNVANRSYLNNEITLSFGCNDSRKYGSISRDRLAVGVPMEKLDLFL